MDLSRKLHLLAAIMCVMAVASPTAVHQRFSRVKGVRYAVAGSRMASCWKEAGCGVLLCAKECTSSPDCVSFSHSKTEGQCYFHPQYLSDSLPSSVTDPLWSTYDGHPPACHYVPCQNGGTCNNTVTGGFTCSCADGYTGDVCQTTWTNCKAVLDGGQTTSGIYTVYPDNANAVQVYCDQDTDGGGWVVFQRRMNGQQFFNLSMTEYRSGFGKLQEEFWLGLTKMSMFLATGAHTLRLDMGSSPSTAKYASYSDFSMDTGTYTLRYTAFIGGYAGDCFGNHGRNHAFSTPWITYGFCDSIFYGGWWFDECYGCNLNGLYGATTGGGVKWTTYLGSYNSFAWTEMKIRPSG